MSGNVVQMKTGRGGARVGAGTGLSVEPFSIGHLKQIKINQDD